MWNIKDFKISLKLGLLVSILLVGFAIFCIATVIGLNRVQVNGPVYVSIVQGKDLIADILPPPEYIIETHLTSLQMLLSLENGTYKEDLPALIQKTVQLRSDFSSRHTYWETVLTDGALRTEMLQKAYQPAEQYFNLMNAQFVPAVQAGDLGKAKKILNETLSPLYLEHRQAIDQVNTLASQANSALEAATANEVQLLWLVLGAISLAAATSGIVMSIWISRGIVLPVGQMVTTARRIALGDVAQTIDLHSKDELGQLADAFR